MAEASIPVDLLNPGQVFACLGFMEVSEKFFENTRAGFDWSDPLDVRFRLQVDGEDDPVRTALDFVDSASVTTIAPAGSNNETSRWKIPTVHLTQDDAFPFADPSSPATLPAVLEVGDRQIAVNHWGDGPRMGRDNVKFWAGSGGYPGVALLRDALDLVRQNLATATSDPFAVGAPQSSSFRFDWRRDYIPLDAGFSLNEHGRIQPIGYPLVEVFAAIGLSHARPRRETKLRYHYGVIGKDPEAAPDSEALLHPALLRAALGATVQAPFSIRVFTMNLGWPGQVNQARCITTVTEDPSP